MGGASICVQADGCICIQLAAINSSQCAMGKISCKVLMGIKHRQAILSPFV